MTHILQILRYQQNEHKITKNHYSLLQRQIKVNILTIVLLAEDGAENHLDVFDETVMMLLVIGDAQLYKQ